MSSPAKRRKIDKDVKPKASLDYFFGKQHAKPEQDAKPEADPEPPEAGNSVGTQDEDLTDEELARRLQEQWSKEDQLANGAATPDAAQTLEENHTGSEVAPGQDATEAPDGKGSADGVDSGEVEESYTAGSKHTLSLQSASASEDTTTPNILLDQSPLTFDPSVYIHDLKKQWSQEGGSATYALLTRCFVLVNSTQSRIKIVDNLVNLLRLIIEADPQSLLPAVSLVSSETQPRLTSTGLACHKLHRPTLHRP